MQPSAELSAGCPSRKSGRKLGSLQGRNKTVRTPVLFWASGDGMWHVETGAMRAPLAHASGDSLELVQQQHFVEGVVFLSYISV